MPSPNSVVLLVVVVLTDEVCFGESDRRLSGSNLVGMKSPSPVIVPVVVSRLRSLSLLLNMSFGTTLCPCCWYKCVCFQRCLCVFDHGVCVTRCGAAVDRLRLLCLRRL